MRKISAFETNKHRGTIALSFASLELDLSPKHAFFVPANSATLNNNDNETHISQMTTPTKATTVQVLFPMGGLGTRFADIGVKTPKPLIPVDGEPMILRAISSFARLAEHGVTVQPIFIVREQHERDFGLATLLRKAVPAAKLVLLDHDTRGAVETCLVAESALDPAAPLVICDCDLYFRSRAYEETLLRMAHGESGAPAGLLVYMTSSHPRYSFAQTADDGRTVLRTAEKVPISDKALIGGYGFGSAAIFAKAAHALMALPIDPEKGRKEYYVSLLFNFLLADGLKVEAVMRDEYESFGTPEELAEYVAKTKEQQQQQQHAAVSHQ
jgi:dTDP-glucose pyrophosphorylase